MKLLHAAVAVTWDLSWLVFTVLIGCADPTIPYIHETSLAGSPGQPGVTDWESDTLDVLELRNPLDRPVRMWVLCTGGDRYESDVPAHDQVRVLITELVRDAGHACILDAWEPR